MKIIEKELIKYQEVYQKKYKFIKNCIKNKCYFLAQFYLLKVEVCFYVLQLK